MSSADWGSCSSCGGDRELASLDAEGRCECCPAPMGHIRMRLSELTKGSVFLDGNGVEWRKGKPYDGHRGCFHAARVSDGYSDCFAGNVEFRVPTVDLCGALKAVLADMESDK